MSIVSAAFLLYACDLAGKLDLLTSLDLGRAVHDGMREAVARNRDACPVLSDPPTYRGRDRNQCPAPDA